MDVVAATFAIRNFLITILKLKDFRIFYNYKWSFCSMYVEWVIISSF